MENTILLTLLTLAVGTAFGLIFFRLKVPGGLIVGSIIGTAILGLGFEAAYIPGYARTVAQIVAGAFIGSSVGPKDLRRLPAILKPYLILITGYLALDMIAGFTFLAVSPLDAMTSFMSGVAGGMTDIPVIAADMGADVPKVAVLQFVRMAAGLGVFPMMIAKAMKITPRAAGKAAAPGSASAAPKAKKPADPAKSPQVILMTMAVACAFGFFGKWTGIPAGAILFSTVSALVFKLTVGKGYIPRWLKRVAQVLTGCYIGCYFGRDEIMELRYLILPAVILLVLYFGNCFFMGWLIPKFTHLTRAEAMLIATPAGASDMALIASDLGVENPDVSFIQIIRMITVVTVFPHIINLVVHLIGG